MSAEAAEMWRLASQADAVADALRGARYGEFAEATAVLESADPGWLRARDLSGDAEAMEAARALKRSLDRVGALLGHLAGVHLALRALDPAQADGYDRAGSEVQRGRRTIHEEA